MSDIEQDLQTYAQCKVDIDDLTAKLNTIESRINGHVAAYGSVEAYGVKGYMKQGRKSVDHKAAVDSVGIADEVIEKFTTRKPAPKPTIAWAKITKQEKIPLDEFTTYGDPVFTIEV